MDGKHLSVLSKLPLLLISVKANLNKNIPFNTIKRPLTKVEYLLMHKHLKIVLAYQYFLLQILLTDDLLSRHSDVFIRRNRI